MEGESNKDVILREEDNLKILVIYELDTESGKFVTISPIANILVGLVKYLLFQ